MTRAGYQVLGFLVWNGGKLYLRRRYGDAPKKLLSAGLIAVSVGGLVFAAKRAESR